MDIGRELSDGSPLKDDVAFKLRLAYAAVMRRYDQALKPFDLRPSLYAALVIVASNPGRKQNEIGEALGMAASNLATLMNTLEGRGLIPRERVAGDVRSYSVTLTGAGDGLLTQVKAAHAQATAEILEIVGGRWAPFVGVLADLANAED
jgi:DNA-binding MarR family transcriptional regulator